MVQLADVCPASSCHSNAQVCAFIGVSVEIAANSCRHLGAEIFRTFKQEFEQFVSVILPDDVSFGWPVKTGYLKGPMAGSYRYGGPCPSSEFMQFVLLVVFR
jgi:hypothetical protein